MSELIDIRLIRHAKGSHMLNPDLIIGRSLEARLVEEGITQADAKGRELARRGIFPDKVFSSPAVRCKQTGRIILNAMSLETEIQEADELVEMDQGDFVGLERVKVYTDKVRAQIRERGKDFALPGGESMNQVGVRGFNWLQMQEVHGAHDKLSIFAIAHAGLITHTVGAIEGWDHPRSLEMLRSMPPVAETRVVFDGTDWHVDSFAQPIQDV